MAVIIYSGIEGINNTSNDKDDRSKCHTFKHERKWKERLPDNLHYVFGINTITDMLVNKG
jgi:hypothetical protein